VPEPRTATFHNYCDAVERDSNAHPIQKASIVVPEGVFVTAGQLYDYSVCSYDASGSPLSRSSLAREAVWVLFDNVYVRTSGGRAPGNAIKARALAAGFAAKGGPRNPERAAQLWQGAEAQWGRPGLLSQPDPKSPT
jgi:hypothetical protein